MGDEYLSEGWYPDCTQISNKEFPSAPQNDDYRYYQVLFEGDYYYCYVEVHKDYGTKVVGFLSMSVIETDGPDEAVIVPAPCKSFDIGQDDKEIINQFLEKYKDAEVFLTEKDVTKFLGIPIDGTKNIIQQKLVAKGFKVEPSTGMLEGEFNGEEVYISILTNRYKVWAIGVFIKEGYEYDSDAIIAFNHYIDMFNKNDRYLKLPVDQHIPEDENLFYQIMVNNKTYSAYYAQIPEGDPSEWDPYSKPKNVCVAITKGVLTRYNIVLLYTNEYNRPDGEDL